MTRSRSVSFALLLFSAAALLAQAPTGTVVGRVSSSDQPMSGVLVTITGPAAFAPRTATTSASGEYTFPSVPPGRYTLTFETQGFRTMTHLVEVHIADTVRADTAMHPTLHETVTTVAGGSPDTPQVSASFDAHLVNILPIGRSILDVVRIAPGVQDTGSVNQLVINGAQSYDNIYLVNGVTISQEVNGQPHNLFIEDAIQETTVLTAGISAEYGRFTGGVVSVITKSGGNELSGSLRDTLTSDKWTARTPFANEPAHLDKIDNSYEATLGGRLVRDRLWFFVAGRYASRNDARRTTGTNIDYTHRMDDNRYEAKLTANVTPRHSIVASYINATAKRVNDASGLIADLQTTVDATIPNTLAAAHYTGIFGTDLVGEAQYSRKTYELGTIGGTSTDLVFGTQLVDPETNVRAWSPILCGVCSKAYRNNHDLIAKGTWFTSTQRLGSHSVVAGIDDFHETYFENAHQTASDYMLLTPLSYAGQNVIARVVPGVTEIVWQPLVAPARPTDFRSFAAFANDRIDLGTHFTFNLGARYDTNRGHDANGVLAVDDSRISPRAGVIYDLFGDGRHRFSASYSVYASKLAEPATFSTSIAGTPAYFAYDYEGPEINTSGTPLPTDEVLRRVFAWLDSVNRDDFLIGSFYPGGEEIASPLQSPFAREVAAGYGLRLGNKGMVRADYVHRRWGAFYAKRATLDLGRTKTADGTPVDRVLIESSDDTLKRKYDGVLLQGSYQFLRRLSLGGNYTWSRLTGNVENENGSGVAAAVPEPGAYYPEYQGFAQNAPVGYLSSDVRHRANIWLAYSQPTRAGQFDVSLLERYHSARNYNATALVEMRRIIIKNPGYVITPSAAYYFAPRGSLRVDDVSATDLGFNWSIPIRGAQVFAEADVQNVFNESAIENPTSLNRTVNINRNDRNLAIFNPFTTAPIECPRGTPTSSAQCKGIANYQYSAAFGTPNGKGAYQQPRTLRISAGVRF